MTVANLYAKTAFEREAGPGVVFMRAQDTDRGMEFTFRITARNSVHTIATAPTGKGRQSIEDAAGQAGRWAAVMAERSAA